MYDHYFQTRKIGYHAIPLHLQAALAEERGKCEGAVNEAVEVANGVMKAKYEVYLPNRIIYLYLSVSVY